MFRNDDYDDDDNDNNNNIFFSPVPPHVLMNFRGFPPGCGDSLADF